MKKLISVLLSVVMLVSVSAVSMSAFAATVQSYEETTINNKITLEVNGKTATDITYERDPEDPNVITFTYTGDGELLGWEFPGMVEGTDYEILSEDGNSITIQVSPDYTGEIVANAIVKDANGKTTKKNGSATSPKTGVGATGLAVAGAGAAILLALKKKDDAE